MIVKRLIFLLSLLCATQATALELTVEECVLIALQQNENFKALEAEVEINDQDANIAYADLFPTIHLESSYTARDQPPRFTLESGLFGPGLPPDDAHVEGEREHYTAGIRLRQALFTGGRLTGTHERQNLLTEARRNQLEDQKSRLVYEIKRSFYQALTRRYELSGIAETALTQAEELRILRELLSQGKATRDEILGAESQLLFAKAAELQAEQALQNALDDLALLLGTDEPLVITEPKTFATLPLDMENLQDVALHERNDIKRLSSEINAASQNIQVARSGYYPQLNLEASYLKQRETDITESDIWEAGIRLDWPIFEAGKTNAEVARAKAEQLRLKHLRQDLEHSVVNEVKAALRAVHENETLVEAHHLQLLATEQEHAYHLELFQAGKQKALDVLKSRAKLTTANANYRAAINQLRVSLVGLETALSVPLDDRLIVHEIYQPELISLKKTLSAPMTPLATAPREMVKDPSNSRYAIQLGAFRSTERAHAFMSSLHREFPERTFVIVSTDGWQKVRSSPFPSRKAAETTLAEFRVKGFVVHENTDHTRPD